MMLKPDRFHEIVTLAKEMGFDQSGSNFILVICVMSRMTKLNWERKVKVFRSLGWSEDEFLSAFKLQPMCMITSQEKIRRVVDLVGTQMDLKPSSLSKHPNVFLLSLEKTIAPRCSVLRVLIQNSLIKKDLSITWALKMSEDDFLERFVIKYEENIPEIQTIYQD
ncbi:uncharacterized protein LOC131253999 [Magnolia sinica]|uniref:uncharacterized protein LOC131253999 n=1 Tax=Magnolia sinica TaxID=86752 RepID=UPI002657DECA|nr:uncharacterized protein LOC131253999 [Magnolia sinica]